MLVSLWVVTDLIRSLSVITEENTCWLCLDFGNYLNADFLYMRTEVEFF